MKPSDLFRSDSLPRMFPRSFAGASLTTRDDRTPEQHETHLRGVAAQDAGMSGWGGSKGEASHCVWACAPGVDAGQVLRWVESRSDMQGAELVDLADYDAPTGAAHLHIYVVNPGHPATHFRA